MGNPYGDNQITTIVQGNTSPALVRTLKTTAGDTVVLAGGDTVRFRLVNKITGSIVVNDATATISDGASGQVTYAWGQFDTTVCGLYEEQWKVVFAADSTYLTVLQPGWLNIRPLDESRYTQSGWIMALGQAKGYLGTRSSDDDAMICELIAGASRTIADYLGYNITDQTYTHDGTTLKRLDGTGLCTMWLSNRPVTALSALSFEGIGGSLPITDPSQFVWYDSGEMTWKQNYIFPLGRQNVSVTYRAGYTTYDGTLGAYKMTMPQPVIQVCYELMGRKMQEWERKGPQIQSVELPQGGGRVTFSANKLTTEQKQMLAPYAGPFYLPQAAPMSRWATGSNYGVRLGW